MLSELYLTSLFRVKDVSKPEETNTGKRPERKSGEIERSLELEIPKMEEPELNHAKVETVKVYDPIDRSHGSPECLHCMSSMEIAQRSKVFSISQISSCGDGDILEAEKKVEFIQVSPS